MNEWLRRLWNCLRGELPDEDDKPPVDPEIVEAVRESIQEAYRATARANDATERLQTELSAYQRRHR